MSRTRFLAACIIGAHVCAASAFAQDVRPEPLPHAQATPGQHVVSPAEPEGHQPDAPSRVEEEAPEPPFHPRALTATPWLRVWLFSAVIHLATAADMVLALSVAMGVSCLACPVVVLAFPLTGFGSNTDAAMATALVGGALPLALLSMVIAVAGTHLLVPWLVRLPNDPPGLAPRVKRVIRLNTVGGLGHALAAVAGGVLGGIAGLVASVPLAVAIMLSSYVVCLPACLPLVGVARTTQIPGWALWGLTVPGIMGLFALAFCGVGSAITQLVAPMVAAGGINIVAPQSPARPPVEAADQDLYSEPLEEMDP